MAVGVRLTEASGEYVSTPDHADLNITGDLCLVAHVALDDWTPVSNQGLIGKYNTTANRNYSLAVDATTGDLQIFTSEDGSTTRTGTSSEAPTISDGEDLWVASTLDVDDGGGNRVYKFWTSTDGVTWTQLGTTQTVSGTTSIHAGANPLEIGSVNGGITWMLAGIVYYAAVYDGIGANTAPGQGTLVASWTAEESGVRHRDPTGKIWTLSGSAYSTVIDDN